MAEAISVTIRVPDSTLPHPSGLWNWVKYIFWKGIAPFFVFGETVFHILHQVGRQEYVFGKLAPGRTVDAFLTYLHMQGFGNHFIAWKDEGQLVSIRKLDGFERQYHLRIFEDGEIRGHYEYTPESHPVWHMKEVGFEERRSEFINFLGDWVVPPAAQK